MNFELRKFLMDGLRDAVGKMADYQIILNAAGWHERHVLTEEDLAEIQALIDAKNMKTFESEHIEEIVELA